MAMRIGSVAAGWVALAGLAAACSGGGPCAGTTCASIEGRYAMTYQDASYASADCATLTAPAGPATIEILRSGAELHATFLGVQSRGVLQDSFDFSLAATADADGGTQSYTLRGYYVPQTKKPDGGEPGSIIGKWVTRSSRGAAVCEAERPCTGLKQ